ncbi:MAG: CCA tRNA nucleotidyltransferase [Spirochaetaceae bacterium]|nr:CCA tRNA nucleotidyltransferase [Spirochaetaceae bacterium]
MKTVKIPIELQKMHAIFKRNGFEAYLVGGAVRDSLLGKKISDYDVTTNATPSQVMQIFNKVIPTGIEHGTVTVLFLGQQVEVTTFRTETDYTDGRHPNSINFTSKIDDDLSRRDFTINAMAASLETGEVIDLFSGKKDLEEKIIRTVGNPLERFTEDGLRPIRAIRFSTQLNFTIEDATFAAISQTMEIIQKISIERFRDEFTKILSSTKPSKGLFLLQKTGILSFFIPELAQAQGIIQRDFREFHTFDVFEHCLYACDGATQNNIILRLAALFHDIGKVQAKKVQITDGKKLFTFYNHEKYSTTITNTILTRLKYPKAIIQKVCHLIENHMFHYEETWTDAAIRRFIVKIGKENIDDILLLRKADVFGKTNSFETLNCPHWQKKHQEFVERLESELQKDNARSLKDLHINGNDLIQNGIPSGKKIGVILNTLFEEVTNDPTKNSRDYLMKKALELHRLM